MTHGQTDSQENQEAHAELREGLGEVTQRAFLDREGGPRVRVRKNAEV